MLTAQNAVQTLNLLCASFIKCCHKYEGSIWNLVDELNQSSGMICQMGGRTATALDGNDQYLIRARLGTNHGSSLAHLRHHHHQ